MARQVATVPASWRERGVRYVPEIDGNRADPDPFWVLLRPLSAAESARIHGAQAMRGLKVRLGDDGAVKTEGDATDLYAASEAARAQAVRVAVLEVHGYSGRNTITGEVITPRTGAELVDFIERHAWDSEAAVLEDLYRAVTDRSHLERALGEGSGSPSDTSTAATQASVGAAPDAGAPAMSTTRTDPPSPNYVAPEGVTMRMGE